LRWCVWTEGNRLGAVAQGQDLLDLTYEMLSVETLCRHRQNIIILVLQSPIGMAVWAGEDLHV
jgi:hypothetical protein